MGASFDGNNILVYNTDDTPQVFADKVITLIGAINENGRIRSTIRKGYARLKRNGGTHSPEAGIRGYAEGSILDGEVSPLATDIALRILRHTGGRLKSPDARSFFTTKDHKIPAEILDPPAERQARGASISMIAAECVTAHLLSISVRIR
jgi:hypothetical protein